MSGQLVLVCLAVGLGTYLFRYLPTRWRRGSTPVGAFGGAIGRFLGSVGIAAVAALLAASVHDLLAPVAVDTMAVGELPVRAAPLLLGVAVTLLSFRWRRSVALSTLLGAAAYGFGHWLLL